MRLTSMTTNRRPVAVLALIGGLLGACAAPADQPPGAQQTPPPRPATDLTVTVAASPKATPKTWTLTCDPAGGTHPKAADACDFVAKTSPQVLKLQLGHTACSMIFGGSQVATVKGTWRGTPVDAQLSRTNGCEITRWNRVKPLLGDAAG